MDAELEWARLTAAEVSARAAGDALAIVPVASLEQHGPHLATGTDIVLAGAVALETARRMAGQGAPALVLPVVWTGLADHHLSFGGTVSLTYAEFAGVLGGVLRSVAGAGFRRALLLNGHGGNAEAVAIVAGESSRTLGLAVAATTYWHAAPDAIAPLLERQTGLMHACEAETSMMLALQPGSVRTGRLPDAHGPHSTRPAGQPAGLIRRRDFRAVTPSGVIGDARGATAERGARLLDAVAQRLAALLVSPSVWE